MKCIIVEDEKLAQQVIATHLQRFVRFQLMGICSNTAEAMAILAKEDIDLMFLDIQLPGTNGLQFLDSLENPPLVIITTAYPEYAADSYEYNVVDYLLKPISFERFSKAINRISDGRFDSGIKEKDSQHGNHIFIKSSSKFFKINFADIIYIEGMRDYLKIHTLTGTVVTHQTMQQMEEILPAGFIRIHRSYIVSVPHIKSISGNTIEIADTSLPIGNLYKEQVMKLTWR